MCCLASLPQDVQATLGDDGPIIDDPHRQRHGGCRQERSGVVPRSMLSDGAPCRRLSLAVLAGLYPSAPRREGEVTVTLTVTLTVTVTAVVTRQGRKGYRLMVIFFTTFASPPTRTKLVYRSCRKYVLPLQYSKFGTVWFRDVEGGIVSLRVGKWKLCVFNSRVAVDEIACADTVILRYQTSSTAPPVARLAVEFTSGSTCDVFFFSHRCDDTDCCVA